MEETQHHRERRHRRPRPLLVRNEDYLAKTSPNMGGRPVKRYNSPYRGGSGKRFRSKLCRAKQQVDGSMINRLRDDVSRSVMQDAMPYIFTHLLKALLVIRPGPSPVMFLSAV